MKSQKLKYESGRSMVEMLGVLAVIGILSVAGVAAYNNAMNKHQANELLNAASKRAVMVAGQLLTRNEASTTDFASEQVAGGTFVDGPITTANGQFTLTINGVSEAVCNHLKNAVGPVIQDFKPVDCATTAKVELTYNNDLSIGGASNSDPQSQECHGHGVMQNDGTCLCNEGYDPYNQCWTCTPHCTGENCQECIEVDYNTLKGLCGIHSRNPQMYEMGVIDCDCDPGYGPGYNSPCRECAGHGKLTDGVCVCEEGYTGSLCSSSL